MDSAGQWHTLQLHLKSARAAREAGDVQLALQEVDAAFARFRKQLDERKTKLSDYLAQERLSEVELRRQMLWDFAWARYVKEQATDEKLAAYFEKHRRDFDGTEVRASHVLLPVASPKGPAEVAAAVAKAGQLREAIVTGKLTFGKAAESQSAGASRQQGGDQGFIPRHNVMNEEFSRAAFALEKNQISPPVVSPFGVHLIQCTDIRPGKQTWQTVRGDLKAALLRDQFLEIAKRRRALTKITYSGALPTVEGEASSAR